MIRDELNHMAHQIAYTAARTDLECMVAAVFADPEGNESAGGSIDNRWYDLSAYVESAFERECIARAVHYMEGRGLIQRHPKKPFFIRVSDAPGEEMPVEGMRLVPLEEASA